MSAVTRRELLRYGIVVLVALVVPPRADAIATHAEKLAGSAKKPPIRPHKPVKTFHMTVAAMVASETR